MGLASSSAVGQAAEAATLAASSYSRPSDAPTIGYGTAGFRTNADVLDNVLYRMGILAALRSKALGKKVGVMITASHNPEKDNGVKLVEPMGEMMPQDWEAHATRMANAADSDLKTLVEELSSSLSIDLNAMGEVVVGRDTRPSSSRLAMAVCDGVGVLRPSNLRSVGVVTTPQLHYIVRCQNDPSYGVPSLGGYQDKLMDAFGKLLSSGARSPRRYKGTVNVDCACGVGSIALSNMVEALRSVGLAVKLVNRVGDGPLNEGCGADFVKTKQMAPAHADASGRWVSFDGDADRIVYFFSKDGFCLLDGDRIALLLSSFVKSLLTSAGAEDIQVGLVQTAYANGASTERAKVDLGDAQVTCAKTGVKHCHHAALAYDVGVYFEANGHGTLLFSKKLVDKMQSIVTTSDSERKVAAEKLLLLRDLINETVGDAISIFLAVEAVLYLTDSDCETWRAMYDDLPNRQIKVVVADRSIFETTDAERQCVKPGGLQAEIDKSMAKVPKGRAFVRPSGTEDVVRVYAEAETEEAMLQLAQEVVDVVYSMAGGVGEKPSLRP